MGRNAASALRPKPHSASGTLLIFGSVHHMALSCAGGTVVWHCLRVGDAGVGIGASTGRAVPAEAPDERGINCELPHATRTGRCRHPQCAGPRTGTSKHPSSCRPGARSWSHVHQPPGEACSRRMAREARTPAVAHAARWSPGTSSGRRQAQVRGASASGGRNREEDTEMHLGNVTSSRVGRTVRAREDTRRMWLGL